MTIDKTEELRRAIEMLKARRELAASARVGQVVRAGAFARVAITVAIALPLFESLPRAFAAAETEPSPPQRMVCIGNEFGMYPGAFWPKSFGRYKNMPDLWPDHGGFARFPGAPYSQSRSGQA